MEGDFLPSYECGGQAPCLGEFLLWEACLHSYGVEFDAIEVGRCACDTLGLLNPDAQGGANASGPCDGVTSWVPGRPSDTGAGPGWTVDGVAVAVAAGSGPGWVEACGCAESDSAARRARGRADSRTVTFSMAMVARSVVGEKQVLGKSEQATEGKHRLYTWSVCAPRTTATHTRLPTRANPPTARTQPSTRPTLVPRTGHHSGRGRTSASQDITRLGGTTYVLF